MNREFENKVTIVTGGGQGIGPCIAQAFLNAGANVVIAGQTPNQYDWPFTASVTDPQAL